jgi:hypothetical protein
MDHNIMCTLTVAACIVNSEMKTSAKRASFIFNPFLQSWRVCLEKWNEIHRWDFTNMNTLLLTYKFEVI